MPRNPQLTSHRSSISCSSSSSCLSSSRLFFEMERIELAQAPTGPDRVQPLRTQGPVAIQVKADNSIWLQERKVTPAELTTQLRQLKEKSPHAVPTALSGSTRPIRHLPNSEECRRNRRMARDAPCSAARTGSTMKLDRSLVTIFILVVALHAGLILWAFNQGSDKSSPIVQPPLVVKTIALQPTKTKPQNNPPAAQKTVQKKAPPPPKATPKKAAPPIPTPKKEISQPEKKRRPSPGYGQRRPAQS